MKLTLMLEAETDVRQESITQKKKGAVSVQAAALTLALV